MKVEAVDAVIPDFSTFGLVHVSPVSYLISSNIYLESTETYTVVPLK